MLKTLNVCATVINFHTSNSSLVHSSIIAQLLSMKGIKLLAPTLSLSKNRTPCIVASRCGSCQCLILSSSLFSLTCKNKPTPAQESLISRAKPPQAQSPRSARAPDTDDKNLASPCIYDDPLKNALSVLVALSINSNYLTMDG